MAHAFWETLYVLLPDHSGPGLCPHHLPQPLSLHSKSSLHERSGLWDRMNCFLPTSDLGFTEHREVRKEWRERETTLENVFEVLCTVLGSWEHPLQHPASLLTFCVGERGAIYSPASFYPCKMSAGGLSSLSPAAAQTRMRASIYLNHLLFFHCLLCSLHYLKCHS